MRTTFQRLAAALGVLAAVLLVGLAAPAAAQQVNPTALSVQEEAMMEALQGGDANAVAGRVSIPNRSAADLIKPAGRDWSDLHRNTMFQVTVWTIVGMLALLAIFYLVRGRIRIESGWSGRSILRFTGVERFGHWLTAVCFIILALTGLNLVLGRTLLLPVLGEGAFGTLSGWGKLAHNYLAWPFMLGVLLIFLVWVRDNLPTRRDGEWIRRGGGMFRKGEHVPAERFNAGQKLIFWSVVLGGAVMSFTGVLLIFPDLAGSWSNWQTAQVVHGIAGAIMIAIILAHIYIGTLGMEGAYSAMGSGEVDLNWAREHHSLWVERTHGTGEGAAAHDTAGRPVAPAE